MAEYAYPPHKPTILDVSDLTLSRSKEILYALAHHEFCRFCEAGKFEETGAEYLVFDVDVQRPQYVVNDVKYTERILVEVETNNSIPWAYALRNNFPALPHQNLKLFDKPKCLCLYEQPSEEVAISWTAFSFLERIRYWLSSSASGSLHQNDQPLEPFILFNEGTITFPMGIKNGDTFNVVLASSNERQVNLVVNTDPDVDPKTIKNKYHALFFDAKARLHGIIKKHPQNLLDLFEMFESCGLDLSKTIKELSNNQHLYKLTPIFILTIPTKRTEGGHPERVEHYAFMCITTIEEIGLSLKLLDKLDNQTAPLIGVNINRELAKNTTIGVLKPYIQYDKKFAQSISGIANNDSIVQIGVGALGSGIFNLLSRAGFGKEWTLVDNDVLLPHNLYRHSLLGFQVGKFKSDAVSQLANHILGDSTYSLGIQEKIHQNTLSADLQNKFQTSDLIIDTSASLAVSRLLSQMDQFNARRVSIFLNPNGNDLLVIAEDIARLVKLDELEMLYYKFLYEEPKVENHFHNDTMRVRYGYSCRDVSNIIPNEYFGIFSAIAVNKIKSLNLNHSAFVDLWHLNEDMGVEHFSLPISKFNRLEINNWNVVLSQSLLDRMAEQRQKKLPAETGGILIGSYDMNTKTIYVVDSIFSPKDSKEYPTAYYRGIDGLTEQLDKIEKTTNNFLTYIGEWHSHPNGCSVNQSHDDLILFAWISNFMQKRGFPGLMMILGENDNLGIYLS